MSESGIEREDICDSGIGKGHRYGCHIFECDGIGCVLPAGFCDCDHAERLVLTDEVS
jgi:hypothetical protein